MVRWARSTIYSGMRYRWWWTDIHLLQLQPIYVYSPSTPNLPTVSSLLFFLLYSSSFFHLLIHTTAMRTSSVRFIEEPQRARGSRGNKRAKRTEKKKWYCLFIYLHFIQHFIRFFMFELLGFGIPISVNMREVLSEKERNAQCDRPMAKAKPNRENFINRTNMWINWMRVERSGVGCWPVGCESSAYIKYILYCNEFSSPIWRRRETPLKAHILFLLFRPINWCASSSSCVASTLIAIPFRDWKTSTVHHSIHIDWVGLAGFGCVFPSCTCEWSW